MNVYGIYCQRVSFLSLLGDPAKFADVVTFVAWYILSDELKLCSQ